MFPVQDIEDAILSVLERSYSPPIYKLWFSELRILSMDENTGITFSVPTAFKKDQLLSTFKEAMENAIKEACGFPFPFSFVVNNVPAEPREKADRAIDTKTFLSIFGGDSEKKKNKDIGENIIGPAIVKEYTFDNFIVGDSNKFAHAACLAVSRSMASYNPLFLYGQSGLGKTHLLYAITNEMKKNNPHIRIIYKKGEDFTNELIASIQGGSTSAFREKYRTADVLLIDDIQFIAGKESTQEEFFHTFSALYEEDKQIILTSDRPPKEIRPLEDRLRTRFEWGLIADIQPPSLELRTAIIQKKAESLHIRLHQNHLSRMAEHLNCNIRQIEGAIKKLGALVMLENRPLTDEDIDSVIREFDSKKESPEDTLKKIFSLIEEKYEVTEEDIKSSKRNANIAFARHITVYLVNRVAELSFARIASLLNRDHSTILASNANIEEKMKKDPAFDNEITDIISRLKG